MSTSKPDLSRIWAETADPSDIIDPDVAQPGKFSAGWEAELPPFEYFNYLQKLFTQGLAHINEQGVPVWDSVTTYPALAIVKGSNGSLYRAVLEQSNNDPTADSGNNWKPFLDIASDNTLQKLYPVGEMLITLRSGNPNTWLGFGTWVRLAEGKTLVGYDSSDADFNSIKKTGGVKSVTLTQSQIPPHTHTYQAKRAFSNRDGDAGSPVDGINANSPQDNTGSAGGGAPHTNLQPYLVTNIWERTA